MNAADPSRSKRELNEQHARAVIGPTLVCVECDRRSVGRAFGWEAHLNDGEDELVFYCVRSAYREFHAPDVNPAALE